MLDQARLLALGGLSLFIGLLLFLPLVPVFGRSSLTRRLAPFAGQNDTLHSRSWESALDAATALADNLGERISKIVGVNERLAARLKKAGRQDDSSSFRLRQLSLSMLVAFAAGVFGTVAGLASVATFTLIGIAVALSYLIIEQQLSTDITRRHQRAFQELPVVAEQLATLLSSGYSLGAALARVSSRGSGVLATELKAVNLRVQQGLTVSEALREWSGEFGLSDVERLVGVLAFSTETADLARLVSVEAATVRAEAQRRLAATIDKRSQQVWIPVTIATLIPGVLFLAIPFLATLQRFAGN